MNTKVNTIEELKALNYTKIGYSNIDEQAEWWGNPRIMSACLVTLDHEDVGGDLIRDEFTLYPKMLSSGNDYAAFQFDATLSEIAAVLGHKTLQMVKRYSHISEQHTTEVVTKMNDKIFGK